jgi:hypothetical protein
LSTSIRPYYIVWLDQGLIITGSPSSEGEISSDFCVSSVAFFKDGLKGLQSYIGSSADSMLPWQGYKSQDDYIGDKSTK